MNKNWRVGIIGCGAISRNHIEAFNAVDGAEVTIVCDVDPDRAAATAAQHGVPRHTDSVADLLASGVDVVSVCTPHPTHEEIVLAAAAAGVHVVCEKPIAIELASAERMVAACRAADVRLGVLFQRRFWEAAQQMKGSFVEGKLGTPVLGQCSVLLHRDTSYYSATPWRGTWASDGGGVLMTQAIHYIDLLQWILGEPVEVFGRTAAFKHGDHIEVEDSAVATVRFASGALATIQASTAVNPSLGAQVQVTGSTGATMSLLEFPEGTDGRLIVHAAGGTIDATDAYPAGVDPNVDLGTINGALIPHHTAQIADFIAALDEGRDPAVTGEDATRALRILLAVYESDRTGAPVDLTIPVGKPVPAEIS